MHASGCLGKRLRWPAPDGARLGCLPSVRGDHRGRVAAEEPRVVPAHRDATPEVPERMRAHTPLEHGGMLEKMEMAIHAFLCL